jgi:hypothetical protein
MNLVNVKVQFVSKQKLFVASQTLEGRFNVMYRLHVAHQSARLEVNPTNGALRHCVTRPLVPLHLDRHRILLGSSLQKEIQDLRIVLEAVRCQERHGVSQILRVPFRILILTV